MTASSTTATPRTTTPATAPVARAVTTETIAEAFTRTAREHAGREALSDGTTTLTYAELDARTDRLAHALRGRGLGPGDRLGVHLDRSLPLYEVFLGALKAGLVVVPFNPDHPGGHKARMHRVAEPALVLTDSADPVDGLPGRDCLPVAELTAAARSAPAGPVASGVGPDDPAFVLFTSGSTGEPKGVVIAHRGIARVSRHLTGYTPGPGDRFLQLAQPSFAASTTDIWTCLLRGGRLTVAPQRVPPLGELARLAAREGTTVLNLPVGLFNLLVEHHPETIARARWVIVSGDFPSVPHLARALEVAGGEVFNAFGCTENSALTAVHRLTPADLDSPEVPVGHAMPTVELSVRDEDLRECPPGRVGELCIAGEGLALGYLGDPALTDRKFAVRDGKRLLRTGDLAKRTADGAIVLAGRADQMLKIRGFRVEPRQVEVCAEELPGVQRAVAQAVPDGGAATRLALACLRASGHDVTEAELLEHLRAHLPDYLVPSVVDVLDEFPLNANGKVDRAELAARLAKGADGPPDAAAAPGGGLVRIVRDLLAEVIGDPAVDADTGLIEAGATSLHLIDLGARLEEVTGVALAPDEIADAGSARGIADLVRTRRARG
ncbi:non-ribosomal peptide synthetase [Saccharothrix sp. S26]|uniref:non-ribosomal peptide synthetase n=1 Tax=Saccharothrix sp. S26 TaxID=2907215 RepID=UPI001F37CA92|nr:non-ribosomal peptide synthetase [Saccharothrix sp. S26]MCE7000427.1 non-ribosomal peptide synthetase [Saccharothrix sp. S26]